MFRVRLMQRDLELMRWINDCGFVTTDQIRRRLSVGRSTAYDRVYKLVQRKMLLHESVFHHQPGVYRVTAEGVRVCGSPLPSLRRLAIGSFKHDLQVIDLNLSLCERWGGQFVTERQLRHKAGQKGVGNNGHLNDGLLILPDKRVAIEVELSAKGKSRLARIFEHHYQNTVVDETWYFCGDASIQRSINAFAEKVNFIRVHLLDAFIKG